MADSPPSVTISEKDLSNHLGRDEGRISLVASLSRLISGTLSCKAEVVSGPAHFLSPVGAIVVQQLVGGLLRCLRPLIVQTEDEEGGVNLLQGCFVLLARGQEEGGVTICHWREPLLVSLADELLVKLRPLVPIDGSEVAEGVGGQGIRLGENPGQLGVDLGRGGRQAWGENSGPCCEHRGLPLR